MEIERIDSDRDLPVTAIIRRRVRPGYEAEFELWSKGVAAECQKFAGYLGTRVIHPADPAEAQVTIISFDSYPNYQAWMNSEVRREWTQKVKAITKGSAAIEQFSGLDYWLGTESTQKSSWPPSFKMIVVAYIAIWPLVHFVSPLLQPYLPTNPLLASLISSAVITPLMGYLSLPLVSRIFHKWLVG